MPTVPSFSMGEYAQMQDQASDRPTPEHMLMTAADMHARGQLIDGPTSFSSPGANLKLPLGGHGPRSTRSAGKRR
jgi:hypothetical protein